MDYAALIGRMLRGFKSSKYEDIETAIVCGVLENAGLKKTRNELIKAITARASSQTPRHLSWFKAQGVVPDLRLLEKFYELNISEEDRKVNGAYYTPEHIITYIIDETLLGRIGTVCDPACGSGAFLTEAARYLKRKTKLSFKEIFKECLYGVDILPSNKAHVETILSLLAVVSGEDERAFTFNIYTGDSLGFDWNKKIKNFKGFDFVVGNPPYVRTKNLDAKVRSHMQRWNTANFGNPDLYVPFFELGMSWTAACGRVGYITPSTYLTSVNALLLRKFLVSTDAVEKIVDFNGWQIFKGATTYTCISILSKQRNKSLLFALVNKKEKINKLKSLKFTKIPHTSLPSSEWRLLSKEDAENIFKIENTGSPLYKYVNRFVTGIATLNNDLFLVGDNGAEYLEKEYEGKRYLIERELTKKIIKPNKVKDKAALRNNKERVIYPYELIDGKARVIPESVLARKFPYAYEYLLSIKDRLSLRDKGKRDYNEWYAYGRSQGIKDFGKKIILPMMGNRASFVMVDDPDSLIYCGYAIFAKSDEDYKILDKVLNSEVMWYYIKNTSKNYSGGFKSFAKNYVKNFSIPSFSQREKKVLLSLKQQDEVNEFLWRKYELV